MSMCMYLRRISDGEAQRFRRDPALVLAATLGAGLLDRPTPHDVETLFEMDGLQDVFSHPRGFVGRLKAWFIQRALKNALRRQVEQLRRAHAAMAKPSSFLRAAEIPSPDAIVALHESWQILHYVLTGTPKSGPAPLNVLLSGGEEIGDDLGYGPARLIDSRAMADFSKALAAFNLDTVLRRVDVARMTALGVHSVEGDPDREGQASALEEDLRDHFPALKAFAEKAAADRQGALIWMR